MTKYKEKALDRIARRIEGVDTRAVQKKCAQIPGSQNPHKQAGGTGRRAPTQVKADSYNATNR